MGKASCVYITETMINHTVLEKHGTKHGTKHEYKVNFTMAVHICRVFLHLTTEKDQYDVMYLLKKELIPISSFPKTSIFYISGIIDTFIIIIRFEADLQSVFLSYFPSRVNRKHICKTVSLRLICNLFCKNSFPIKC